MKFVMKEQKRRVKKQRNKKLLGFSEGILIINNRFILLIIFNYNFFNAFSIQSTSLFLFPPLIFSTTNSTSLLLTTIK